MNLREWISRQGMTQREAAGLLCVHEITLNRWIMCRAVPRREQRDRIREVTGGEVGVESFFPDEVAAEAVA
jgi:DNA-binding transcriptional regulator YdaS (Cro superfamily)